MLSFEFFGQNLHFALSLFTGLVFFAIFWLYFDAWVAGYTKVKHEILIWAGFLLVSLSFVLYATIIEQPNFGKSIFGSTAALISDILRLIGYVSILLGQILDPLQKRPVTKGIMDEFADDQQSQAPTQTPLTPPSSVAGIISFGSTSGFGTALALPVMALGVATLYWRRATTGIERHLKPVGIGFLFLFLFELLGLAQLYRGTSNPALFNLVKAFGPLWIASHVMLLCAAIILGWWVWRYLTERFLSQMFMMLVGTILAIFLTTTVSFTFLLLRSVQADALNNLATATSVLNYALGSKKAETLANAEAVASNPAIIQAIVAKDHKSLISLTSDFLEKKQQSSLIVTTADAQVLLRAEDPERWGDSISSDTLVRRALIGDESSTIASQDSVLAPVVSIRTIVPVRDGNGQIVGSVTDAVILDNAFIDGIKHATGLDSAIYSGNVRSATTLTAPDGTSRWIGVKETDTTVQSTVLKNGQTFKGSLSILNRQYLAVYAPLKDVDNSIVGMLFIGQPEISILQTASYLIGLTFAVAVLLLVLSIVPAYLMARHIAKQLE